MNWETEDRAERLVDVVAAVILAAAVGYSLWAVAPTVAVLGAAAAFPVAYFGLRRVLPEERAYVLPPFPEAAFEPLAEPGDDAHDVLILEDELGEVGPDARVVRLFGPSQSHLPSMPAPPDASEALIKALAELRRSFH